MTAQAISIASTVYHRGNTMNFDPEFDALPDDVQNELRAHALLLEQFGPQLGRPRVDTLKGSKYTNMKELRFEATNGEWRAAFAFDPRRKAVLLVAGDSFGFPSTLPHRYRNPGSGKKILLSPAAELRFSQACKGEDVEFTIAAGPEAGFNAEEEAALLDAGFVPARLGARVLRTETAGLAALAALSALRGDF